MDPSPVSAWVALGAGLLSFFSPCVLPMAPVYVLYMTGSAAASRAADGRVAGSRVTIDWRALTHGAFFAAGFGLVFVLSGITVGLLGSVMPQAMRHLVRVGGVLLILLGLHMTGWITLPFLNQERRLDVTVGRHPGYWRSFVIGVIFAAGWTPCIGPALASILALAAASGTVATGARLLAVYSLGLAMPFLAVSALSDVAGAWLSRLGHATVVISRIAGVLLLVMGLLLVTGTYQQLSFRLNALAGSG